MCSHGESNPQPFGARDDTVTNKASSQGERSATSRGVFFMARCTEQAVLCGPLGATAAVGRAAVGDRELGGGEGTAPAGSEEGQAECPGFAPRNCSGLG